MKNNKQKLPIVSVIMGVYNGASFLKEAVDSILSQTFTDFEFIIIDDGSTDGTLKLLEEYYQKDARIVIIEQDNSGLTHSLNRAINLAKGEFIARQDVDDISLPTRLQKQVELLRKNSDIGVCSCYSWVSGDDGVPVYSFEYPTDNRSIKEYLSRGISPITHGSVMFRKSVLQRLAQPEYRFKYGQDFDMWLRMKDCTDFSIIPEELYIYRRGTVSISSDVAVLRQQAIKLMLQLSSERTEFGSEKTDWAAREAEILKCSNIEQSRNLKSYSSGYLDLLSKIQVSALRKLLQNFNIKYIPLILLAVIPLFGYRIARFFHLKFSPFRAVRWYN